MKKIKHFILFFLFVINNIAFSQLEQTNSYGFNVGFVGALGSHVQRFGIVLQGYCKYNFAQLNASFRLYDNFKNLGPKGEHAEMQAALGLCLGYGKKIKQENIFLSSISNQTGYKNSVAYSYNIYFNKIKTSQVTGIVAFQFNCISLITENDIFAKPMLDRFRTGAILLQYQYKNFQYAINGTMWTGQLGKTITNDTLFPYHGYVNTDGGRFQQLSHGILSGQVKWANEYGQYLQANAGVDADEIRNVMQNKTLHSFFPKNYHMPMIDTLGNQYLYRKNQKIREPKKYFNLFTNHNVFY